MRRKYGFLILTGLLCLLAEAVSADGCFVGSIRIPGIPSQRALLWYKDSVERLIIESQVDDTGEPLAWIIPVPTEPTEIKKAAPAVLKILTLHVGAFAHKQGARGGGSGPVVSPVAVLRNMNVADWTVVVLKAENADALNRWLTENGFMRLPEAGIAVVADYISRGWVFVAGKCQSEYKGPYAPAPIGLTFASDVPVYPMRLTSLSGADLYLELFVVAEGTPETPCLDLERSAPSVSACPDGWLIHGMLNPGSPVNHASLSEYLWEGACISKLSGKVTPQQMTSDIVLDIGRPGESTLSVLIESVPPKFRTELSWPDVTGLLDNWFAESAPLRVCATAQDIRDFLRRFFTYTIQVNYTTGERLLFEDSPGNITSEMTPEGLRYKCMDSSGRYSSVLLKPAFRSDATIGPDAPMDEVLSQLVNPTPAIVNELAYRRDPKAVHPFIEMYMRVAGDNDACELIVSLDKSLCLLTGTSFSRNKYGGSAEAVRCSAQWTEWWEEHKEQTRREWLEEAYASRTWPANEELLAELMLAGSPLAERKRDVAATLGEALVRDGQEEGYAMLRTLFEGEHGQHTAAEVVLLRLNTPRALAILLGSDKVPDLVETNPIGLLLMCQAHAATAVAILMDRTSAGLAEMEKNPKMRRVSLEFYVSALGFIAEVVPPLDVRKTDDVRAFLDEVTAKLQTAPVAMPEGL